MPPGLLSAATAYIIWGLFPLYFHRLASVPPLEMVGHRSVWSLVMVLGLLAWQRRWAWLRQLTPKAMGAFTASTALLAANWLLYVWAVQQGRVLEASLGYFINPLFNVLLGVVVLGERPKPMQWVAVAMAGLGVLWLGWTAGAPPWIALGLAASFGLYGLLRKTAPLGAVEGLALETMLLAPLAVPALAWLVASGGAPHSGADWFWLVLAGPLTAVPLLLFAHGARQITLATLGLLQYLGPSIQFMLGLWVFHEPLQPARLLGFGLIWAALAVYTAAAWRR
ncbi:EamA family transporter RarD [Ideonella sp. 4Y11]|uniref:EamA family transporter RarD n=1 Tax=Ideonella aquatica TaxID=2824119 RepID=A0A941BI68_9BURK|nr:EamA family transporter RarD [Ideonella aquatica]MBQ0957538.1 EamA family transporter RarD [Ideonella aquatica]